MSEKNIEVELRAEISNSRVDRLSKKLKKNYSLKTRNKRLAITFFDDNLDVRVRINTGGEAEFVVKKGEFHSGSRIERSQKIKKDQFLGIIDNLLLFDFESVEVMERKNIRFDLGEGMELSLVTAGPIAYVELEKVCSDSEVDRAREKLTNIMNKLNLEVIEKEGFYELCRKLSEKVDWNYEDSEEDKKKLRSKLSEY